MTILNIIKLVELELEKCRFGKKKHSSLISIKIGLLETGTCYISKDIMKYYSQELKDVLIEESDSIIQLKKGCIYDYNKPYSTKKFTFEPELRPTLK